MSNPIAAQVRRAVQLSDGSINYEVSVRITDKGDLPFAELFVLTITDPLNPKADVLSRIAVPHDLRQETDSVYIKVVSTDMRTIYGDPFARVTNIDELTTVSRDRVRAVQQGKTEYLSSSVSMTYTTLTAASSAYTTFLQRLSTLVQDYRNYYNTFRTNIEKSYELPQGSVGTVDALTQAYRSARSARISAETARDALLSQQTTCQSLDAAAQEKIETLTRDVSFLEVARSLVYPMATSDARTFVLNATDPQSYQTLLVSKQTQLETARNALTVQLSECAAIAQQLANAEAVVIVAQRAEEAALRAVYAVCPTFDPTQV